MRIIDPDFDSDFDFEYEPSAIVPTGDYQPSMFRIWCNIRGRFIDPGLRLKADSVNVTTMASDSKRILVICTANICRSPMAERLLGHALGAEPEPWRSFEIVSAGIGATEGQPASENSVWALRKVGLDLSDHRSRAASRELIQSSDCVFGMTRSHLEAVQMIAGDRTPPCHLFREFCADEPEIPDPFGGSVSEYEACRDAMVEAIPSVVRHLKKTFS